jgi:hypothetical protein
MAIRALDGNQMVTKLLARSAVAGADWKAGVTSPRTDPIAAGIAAAGKWASNTQRAITEKRFEKGLAKTDKAAMAATIAATPDSAVSDGLVRREAKIRSTFTRLAPLISAAQNQVAGMAQATDADRIQRMLKNLELMKGVGTAMKG